LTSSSSRNRPTVFQAVALLGFSPTKSSPSTAWTAPSGRPSRLALAQTNPATRAALGSRPPPGPCFPRKSVASSPPKRPVWLDPPLGFVPPPGVFLPPRRPRSSRRPPPMGLDTVGGEPPAFSHPSESSSRRAAKSSAENFTPPGVFAPRPGKPGVGAEQVSMTLTRTCDFLRVRQAL
jgi:hypothetical protein